MTRPAWRAWRAPREFLAVQEARYERLLLARPRAER